MDVSSFQIKGQQVDVVLKDGFISYTFEHDGKGYGQKIKVDPSDTNAVIAACVLLVTSVYETVDSLHKTKIDESLS